MVDKQDEENNNQEEEVEVTNEETEFENPDLDLEEIEGNQKDIINSIKKKLKDCEHERRQQMEDVQKTKADFLNARRRMEEEKDSQRDRLLADHIEKLLPLCDSFQMAMADKEAWEKADSGWRKGIEGIHSQLRSLLNSYSVQMIDPTDEMFDPEKHEALSTVEVSDKKDHDKVINVIQPGYEMTKKDGTTQQIRPARVTIGIYSET